MAAPFPEAPFWAALGLPLQIVALHPNKPVRVIHLSSTADHCKGITQATELNSEGWNIYYEVNLSSQVGKRSDRTHITALRAVVGDIDTNDGRTIEDCREIVSHLPLPPTFVLFTGGGLQVVYLLRDRPAVTPDTIATHQQIGKSLAAFTDGDSVFDLPRIMRLPGFTNFPSAQKRARGREEAKAVVETARRCTYTLDELAASFAPPAAAARSPLLNAIAGGLSGSVGGSGWFNQLTPEDKNACLAEMLRVPAVVRLADTSDGDPSPNWRTVLAACARSEAPDAYRLAQVWAETSARFDPNDFDRRWNSYANS